MFDDDDTQQVVQQVQQDQRQQRQQTVVPVPDVVCSYSCSCSCINNVDEALNALRSQHTFEKEFPILLTRMPTIAIPMPIMMNDGNDDEEVKLLVDVDSSAATMSSTVVADAAAADANNDDDDDIDDDDDDPEILRSIELLKQLNYYYYDFNDVDEKVGVAGSSNQQNQQKQHTSFNSFFTDEEEMELLAKTGSVFGQQSLQFATFPTTTIKDTDYNDNDDDDDHDDEPFTTTTNLNVPTLLAHHHQSETDEEEENNNNSTSFERFWTDAVNGPTPSPSPSSSILASSSTYATTPTTTLSAIVKSMEDDEKEQEANEAKEEADEIKEVGAVVDEIIDDDDFGDFQEATIILPSTESKTTGISAVVHPLAGGGNEGVVVKSTSPTTTATTATIANNNEEKKQDDDKQDSSEPYHIANNNNNMKSSSSLLSTSNNVEEENQTQLVKDHDVMLLLSPVAAKAASIAAAVAIKTTTEEEQEQLRSINISSSSAAVAASAGTTTTTSSTPFPLLLSEKHDDQDHHHYYHKEEHPPLTTIGVNDTDHHHHDEGGDTNGFDNTLMMKTPNTSMVEDDDDLSGPPSQQLARTPPSRKTTNGSSPSSSSTGGGGGYCTPHMTPEYMYSTSRHKEIADDDDGSHERVVEPPTPVTQNRSNTKRPNRTTHNELNDDARGNLSNGNGGDGDGGSDDDADDDDEKDDHDENGMDAFINMVAMVQKDYDLSPTRPPDNRRRESTMDGGIHDDDDDDDDEEEDASDGSQSFQSRSIPSVVQLFTNSSEAATAAALAVEDAKNVPETPDESTANQPSSPFIVPRTVRLMNSETNVGALAMTPSPAAKVPPPLPPPPQGNSLPPRPVSSMSTGIPFSPPSASRIRMIPTLRSSFYTFSTRRNLDSTYNTPALVEQFEKSHKKHTDQSSFTGFSDRSFSAAADGCSTVDNRSLSSSIASPEAKFFRRRNSKPLNRKGDIESSHRRRNSYQPSIDNASNYQGDDDGTTGSAHSDLDEEENRSLGSMNSFPEQFWRYPDNDPTLQELYRLEWDWLPYWQMDRLMDERMPDGSPIDVENVPLLQEQITERLSKLDSLYAKVRQKAYRRIQPHSESLERANRLALDLQRNIQLSQMYLNKSQNAIRQAYYGTEAKGAIHNDMDQGKQQNDGEIVDGLGVLGAVRLLELSDTRDAYDSLNDVVDEISAIYDLENTILMQIQGFDTWQENAAQACLDILRNVEALVANLEVEPANQIRCLDELRKRVPHLIPKTFMSRLHSVLENTAMELCLFEPESSLSSKAYSRLLEVMIMVHQESGGQCDKGGVASFSSAFSTTVQTAFLLQAQKAFGAALLDPVGYENEVTAFAQELFASRHNQQYLDAARIPSWTSNLVTIRFDLELQQQQDDPNSNQRHPLPAVFHKLCYGLAEILHGMHRLITWRPGTEEEFGNKIHVTKNFALDCVEAISNQLNDRRASIWNACIQALENCLDEWLKHVGKLTLFQRSDQVKDDTFWFLDLDSLQRITSFTNRFLSFESDFLHGVSKAVINDGSMVHEKLHTLYKKHLRTVHIEAMNTTGGKLYNETWILRPMAVHSESLSSGEELQLNNIVKVRMMVESIAPDVLFGTNSFVFVLT